jgi:hypothetical protein
LECSLFTQILGHIPSLIACRTLTEYEVFGTNNHSSTTYETMANQAHFAAFYTDDASRIKYKADAVAGGWWEASPDANGTNYFCRVNVNGNAGTNNANYEYGITPAFAVG